MQQQQQQQAAECGSSAQWSTVSPYQLLDSGPRLLSASETVGGGQRSTIVARGQLDGAQCVDILIDTGASCCFVRRGWAERVRLQLVPLSEPVSVTLADRSQAAATHEVRVASMRVHGSAGQCRLLVLDELSNEVIAGLSWLRAVRMQITAAAPYDLLNGQPVRYRQPVAAEPAIVEDEWQLGNQPVRLSAALIHPRAATVVPATECRESLCAADVADLMKAGPVNSKLRRVLQRHQRVFTDVLPVKTAEQIAQARQFSIVLVGDVVRPVKQRERRLSPAEIEAATQWVREEVAAGRMEPSSSSDWAAQLVIVAKRNEQGEVSGWRICGDYRNLNAVTKADAEPLPLMDTVFDQLAGMKYFS